MNDHVKIVNRNGDMWMDFSISDLVITNGIILSKIGPYYLDLDDISLIITYELEKPWTKKTIYEVTDND